MNLNEIKMLGIMIDNELLDQEMSHCELARRTHMHRSTVKRHIEYPEKMQIHDLFKICRALGLKVEIILHKPKKG